MSLIILFFLIFAIFEVIESAGGHSLCGVSMNTICVDVTVSKECSDCKYDTITLATQYIMNNGSWTIYLVGNDNLTSTEFKEDVDFTGKGNVNLTNRIEPYPNHLIVWKESSTSPIYSNKGILGKWKIYEGSGKLEIQNGGSSPVISIDQPDTGMLSIGPIDITFNSGGSIPVGINITLDTDSTFETLHFQDVSIDFGTGGMSEAIIRADGVNGMWQQSSNSTYSDKRLFFENCTFKNADEKIFLGEGVSYVSFERCYFEYLDSPYAIIHSSSNSNPPNIIIENCIFYIPLSKTIVSKSFMLSRFKEEPSSLHSNSLKFYSNLVHILGEGALISGFLNVSGDTASTYYTVEIKNNLFKVLDCISLVFNHSVSIKGVYSYNLQKNGSCSWEGASSDRDVLTDGGNNRMNATIELYMDKYGTHIKPFPDFKPVNSSSSQVNQAYSSTIPSLDFMGRARFTPYSAIGPLEYYCDQSCNYPNGICSNMTFPDLCVCMSKTLEKYTGPNCECVWNDGKYYNSTSSNCSCDPTRGWYTTASSETTCVCNGPLNWYPPSSSDPGQCSCGPPGTSFFRVFQTSGEDDTCRCNNLKGWANSVVNYTSCYCNNVTGWSTTGADDSCYCNTLERSDVGDGTCICDSSKKYKSTELNLPCDCDDNRGYILVNESEPMPRTCQCNWDSAYFSTNNDSTCFCNPMLHLVTSDTGLYCECDGINNYVMEGRSCVCDKDNNWEIDRSIGTYGTCICDTDTHELSNDGSTCGARGLSQSQVASLTVGISVGLGAGMACLCVLICILCVISCQCFVIGCKFCVDIQEMRSQRKGKLTSDVEMIEASLEYQDEEESLMNNEEQEEEEEEHEEQGGKKTDSEDEDAEGDTESEDDEEEVKIIHGEDEVLKQSMRERLKQLDNERSDDDDDDYDDDDDDD